MMMITGVPMQMHGSGLACISLSVGQADSAGRASTVCRRKKWRVHQWNGSGKEENASTGALSMPPNSSILCIGSSDLKSLSSQL